MRAGFFQPCVRPVTERFPAANPAATEHDVTVVNDRSLSGCYGTLRFVQAHMRAIILEWRNVARVPGWL